MFKGLREIMGVSPSWWVTTLQFLVAIGLVQAEIWSLFAVSIVVVDI